MSILFLAALSALSLPAQFMRGKVVMPDGSAPAQKATIERVCPPTPPFRETIAFKSGEYLWRSDVDLGTLRVAARGASRLPVRCFLQAKIPGYQSGVIDIAEVLIQDRPELPLLTLKPAGNTPPEDTQEPPKLTKAALKAWDLGAKAITNQRWPEAESHLREVLRTAPNFSLAWSGLAYALESQQNPAEAREAYRKAVAADPKALLPRAQLTRLEAAAKHWPETSDAAAGLIALDKQHKYPEAYLHHGLARYLLKDPDAAQQSLEQVIRLDTKGQMPQAEYLLGAALAAKGDKEGAASHLNRYLEIFPEAPNSEYVRQQIGRLKRPAEPVPPTPLPVPDELIPSETEPTVAVTGEARVPGGRKALAAVARMKQVPDPSRFFPEYCRAVGAETHPLTSNRWPGYVASLEAFLEAASELSAMGESNGDRMRVVLSLSGPGRPRTDRALRLLGWHVVEEERPAVEPSDRAADAPKLGVARALGIDEFAMRDALNAGREFVIEIVTENLPLAGGSAWGVLMQGLPPMPGGIAQGFVRQPRLARTCAGLGQMEPQVAIALARRVGLRTMVNLYADGVFLHGDGFRSSGGRAVVPGGTSAEPAWEKLVAAPARDAAAFFEALIKADRGRVAPFYAALSRADAGHQAWFTKDADRLLRFYEWFSAVRPAPEWRARLVQELPLDAQGQVRFPGGRAAWTPATSDEEALAPTQRVAGLRMLRPTAPIDGEALLAVSHLEQDRGRPLDPDSARLLARNFASWKDLLPYVAALPGLEAGEFRALDSLTTTVSGMAPAAQVRLAAEWHPLLAILVTARNAGSIDDARAARAFGDLCRTPDRFAWLRELSGAGQADLDEAVIRFLQLDANARTGFDRIRALQRAPKLQPGNPAALAGAVYAALLPSDGLLVNEDARLLSKHVWIGPAGFFSGASLVRSNAGEGSHFAGGFAGFQAIARALAGGGNIVDASARTSNGASGALFRADARLVEVHTTVTTDRGQYVDGLTAERFSLRENESPVPVAAFEPATAPISCALVLDTSESMDLALPALKSAASHLIAALRPNDPVAVYSLSDNLSQLVTFTTDHEAAMRAVRRAEPGGETALYDALVRVNRDMAARIGKKVIVVFTDGDDNASTLTASTAILRARTAGIPIYTIAQGNALHHAALLRELSGMSRATGGLSFAIAGPEQIAGVFQSVLQDLLHGYLLAFRPPTTEDRTWRRIDVLVKAPGAVIRAREGYYPE